jgi:hypothetical protein
MTDLFWLYENLKLSVMQYVNQFICKSYLIYKSEIAVMCVCYGSREDIPICTKLGMLIP